MKEDFLHYLWQYQKFDKSKLSTADGEEIAITKTGFHNTNSGPDFLEARLQIGQIDWAGSVEVHIKSSDWLRHKHQNDDAYANVVLHVVWEHDKEIINKEGKSIPTLILKPISDRSIIERYETLMLCTKSIPCQEQFKNVAPIKKLDAIQQALMRRIERKAELVKEIFHAHNKDWEQTAYLLLAQNFGFKLNNNTFLRLAENLPINILKKYHSSAFQTEAILYGMAGFLSTSLDPYGQKLKTEFDFLAAKHQLKEKVLPTAQWKFMRTRPANFPTIRLSQLAVLMNQSKSLFSVFTETTDFKELVKFFEAKPSEYWKTHYHFNKISSKAFKGIGAGSIHVLIINTVIPLLLAYAHIIDKRELIERAVSFLEKIPAEKNKITKFWNGLDLETKTMFDSQGCIELYNEFCKKKRCLSCGIGIGILSR